MTWVKAAPVDAINGKPIVFNHPPRQIALFKVGARIFAIDNRCPHEGYPLALGHVNEDCVLTCNWHNWKFMLEDGRCVLGGDDVRSYPTRLDDGHAWVDVTDLPPEQERSRILRGLKTAFEKRDFGRICREIARLQFQGLDPKDAIRESLRWSHDRLEFGTQHAIAATADWLTMEDELSDQLEARVICLAEAVDHLADDVLREPLFSYASSDEPFTREGFLEAIEAEQTTRAEAMAAHGLADGLHWPDMEEVFATAALAHYNDFGHSVIYTMKSAQLLDDLGPSVEPYVILPLVRHLGYTTREDLIPEFRNYSSVLASLADPGSAPHSSETLEVPFPASLPKAFEWLEANIANHSAGETYDALLEALSLNLLHFNTSYGTAWDRPVSQNVSWLDFTHGITFSNAVRVICTRYPHLWKTALTQMACFLGRNFSFIDPQLDTGACGVDNAAAFFADVREQLLDHGFREPIFSAHLLKTTVAVAQELNIASPSCRHALLAGLNRFLDSPMKMKHVRRLARQAIDLVSKDFEGNEKP